MPFCIGRHPSTVGKNGVDITEMDAGVLRGRVMVFNGLKLGMCHFLSVTANKVL